MSTTTHVKLGLLVLIGISAGIATMLGLGIKATRTSTVEYRTYFDESVNGLEVGSPVKYRGVRIGRVRQIGIAPDAKHVDVLLALTTEAATRLGIAATTQGLRAQLGTMGVTGMKFVDLDFFDPKTNPPPTLAFTPDPHHIPARASLLKGLGDNLEAIGPKLPDLVDRADATLAAISRVLDDIGDEHVARRFATAADEVARAAEDIRRLVRQVEGSRLDHKAAAALERASTAITHLDELIGRLDGVTGLVASARRATDSIGDVGRTTLGSSQELERTLRELGDAARAVRDAADMIQRDPDVLLKGRARSKKP
jgi:ABC-type transporter Mla subunit MlaD